VKTQAEILRATGGYIDAGVLSSVPGVQSAYRDLLARIQALPFVPSSWSDDVKLATTEAGGSQLWLPRLATRQLEWRAGKLAPLNPDVPDWIAGNDANVRAWNMITDWWTERLQPITAGWARDEAATLEAANADARFWNTVYTIAKPIAVVGETILAAPAAVAGAASTVVTGTLRALLPVIIIVGLVAVGVLIYKRKLSAKAVAP
jgi:hypothetical protein